MNIERFCRDFSRLHGLVIRNWGRIEITSDDNAGDGEKDACVLMSRAELECLERALSILCELPGGQSICKELTEIANRCTHHAQSAMTLPIGEESMTANENRPAM